MAKKQTSIQNKILGANLSMIGVPVFLVVGMLLIFFFSVFLANGGAHTSLQRLVFTTNQSKLSLTTESITGELIENEGDSLEKIEKLANGLEEIGCTVQIEKGAVLLYQSPAFSPTAFEKALETIAGGVPTGEDYSIWNKEGLAYRSTGTAGDGEPFTIAIRALGLPFEEDGYTLWQNLKALAFVAILVVGGAMVAIIVITGSILTKKLYQSILGPMRQLQKATAQIGHGELDAPLPEQESEEFAALFRDFDAMRRQLEEGRAREQQYERNRKELLAGMAHDLSTPLTAIKGYTNGLLDGIAATPEKKEKYLSTIYSSACNMEHLVDSLFLFSKLDLGKVPFHLEPTDLGQYLSTWGENRRNYMESEGLALALTIPQGRFPVLLDPTEFGRVLENLLQNSVKYKKPEGGQVALALAEVGDTVHLTFADTGKGIPPGEAEHIFEGFYRLDQARGAQKGSGLGLAIAREIIRGHGGAITAEGAPNAGLTVTITLPRDKGERL